MLDGVMTEHSAARRLMFSRNNSASFSRTCVGNMQDGTAISMSFHSEEVIAELRVVSQAGPGIFLSLADMISCFQSTISSYLAAEYD